MKKTLISLSVISAFTVVSSPAFAAQTVDPVPGTADSPLAVVIGQGSINTGATSTGVSIGKDSKSVNNSVSIGHKSSSRKDAVSIGEGANAGELSVAIGNNITSSNNSISLGHHSSSSNNSISMGHHSSSSEYGVSLGIKATSGTHSVAIGDSAKASNYGIAMGSGSRSYEGSVVLGHKSLGNYNSVVVGRESYGYADSVSIGYKTTADTNSTAIGHEAYGFEGGTAVGWKARADSYSIAVGTGTSADVAAVALGQNTFAGMHGIAIGYNAKTVLDEDAVAIGSGSFAEKKAIAIGRSSQAKGHGSIAIGGTATSSGAVAIGRNSYVDRAGGVRGKQFSSQTYDLTDLAWTSSTGAFAVGNDSTSGIKTTRQIIGVAAGTELTDAVNVAQLEDLKLYGDDTYATFTSLNNYSTKDELAASLSNYSTKDELTQLRSSLEATDAEIRNDLSYTRNDVRVLDVNVDVLSRDMVRLRNELDERLKNAHFIVETPNGGNNPPANDVNGSSPGAPSGGGTGNASPGGTQQGGNASANNSANVHLGKKLNFTTDANILTSLSQDAEGHTTVNISTAENMSVNSLTAKDITTDNLTVNQALTAKEITADTLTVNQTLKANSIDAQTVAAQKVQAADIVATKSLTAPSITFTDGPTLSYNKDTGHLQYVSNSTTGAAGQGSVVHSVATTSDGITFGANEGSALVNLDNQKLDIKGADEFITTFIKTNGSGATLEIKMTDEFRIAVGNGNLNNGITIGAKDGYQEIHIHQGNINMGGNRIQGVGDAIAPTDAVNKRQLDNAARGIYSKINKVDKDMRAGVAMAMAVASLPQAYMPGKSMLAMSAGTYRGQGGFALGLSHATENKSWVFKGAATADTRGNFGATIGAGYQF